MGQNRAMPQDAPLPPLEFGGDAVAWAVWLYYGEGRTQNEVARALGLSRATIANYLAEGRRRGLVSITLAPELLSDVGLGRALAERWGLNGAHVVPAGGEAEALRDRIARAGGHALRRHMRGGAALGVAWGRTVSRMALALPEMRIPGLRVVQVAGSTQSNAEHSPEFCTSLIAARAGARAGARVAVVYTFRSRMISCKPFLAFSLAGAAAAPSATPAR